MDVRTLRAFVAVFEERNITAAATRLFITQPTLSTTIKTLEDELGVTLFVRQARGVEGTEAAHRLYPRAKRLIAEGRMPRGAMKDLNIHLIADEVLMNELGASSKLRPRPGLLTRLKAAGRVAAEGWLKDHAGAVGRESSVDLRALFG